MGVYVESFSRRESTSLIGIDSVLADQSGVAVLLLLFRMLLKTLQQHRALRETQGAPFFVPTFQRLQSRLYILRLQCTHGQ